MRQLPKARITKIITQETDNELLIYDLESNNAYCLNKISAMVWLFCDGNNSFSELSRLVGAKLKISLSEDFIWLALNELKKNHLLENPVEIDNLFGGMNRREVVKKIGLTSMVALPMIASVVAPSSIMAQSGGLMNVAIEDSCSSDGDCVSGNCAFVFPSFVMVCCSSSSGGLPFTTGALLGCLSSADCAAAGSSCCSGMTTQFPVPSGGACVGILCNCASS